MATKIEGQTVLLVGTALAAGGAICYTLLSSRQTAKNKKKYGIPPAMYNSKYKEHVALAVDLAMTAGEAMRSYCDDKGTQAESQHDLDIAFKGKPEDFCTKIDVENEKLVMDGILGRFPHHKIIGEETTGTGTIPPLTKEPTWIIDPVDGTTNFASGLPLCCVSIGFCMEGRPVMGVVYAPMTDELFISVVGCGAYRNGVKIMPAKSATKLSDAVVCFEFGYARQEKEVDAMVGVVQNIMKSGVKSCRQLGSGVLDLCYVATGRMDVVYAGVASESWKPWDFCAGYVIATESGCVMEPFEGPKEFDLYSKNHICAQNSSLAEEIRQFVKEKML